MDAIAAHARHHNDKFSMLSALQTVVERIALLRYLIGVWSCGLLISSTARVFLKNVYIEKWQAPIFGNETWQDAIFGSATTLLALLMTSFLLLRIATCLEEW